jgi:hypothetical protein
MVYINDLPMNRFELCLSEFRREERRRKDLGLKLRVVTKRIEEGAELRREEDQLLIRHPRLNGQSGAIRQIDVVRRNLRGER